LDSNSTQEDTVAQGDEPTDKVDTDETEPTDQATAADETEDTSEEEAPKSDEDAAPEGDEVSEESDDLTLDDETISAFASAYAEQVLATPEVQEQISARVKDQVDRQVQDVHRSTQAQTESQSLIEQGRTALKGLADDAAAAKDALVKAAKKDESISSDVFDPQKFEGNLRDYGSAIVADVSGTYRRAIEGGFTDILQNKLPKLTDEQAQELQRVVVTAQRMEGDPAQAAQAQPYFMSGLFGFLFSRAFEAGQDAERGRASKRPDVAKKIASSAAVKAAQAKLAASKGNPPPKTPKSRSSATNAPAPGVYDSGYYKELKKSDPTGREAQEYINQVELGRRRVS
jgi:hypothetical protein